MTESSDRSVLLDSFGNECQNETQKLIQLFDSEQYTMFDKLN